MQLLCTAAWFYSSGYIYSSYCDDGGTRKWVSFESLMRVGYYYYGTIYLLLSFWHEKPIWIFLPPSQYICIMIVFIIKHHNEYDLPFFNVKTCSNRGLPQFKYLMPAFLIYDSQQPYTSNSHASQPAQLRQLAGRRKRK